MKVWCTKNKEEKPVFKTACIRYDERGTTVFWYREHKVCVLTTQHKNVTRQMHQTQVDCCNPSPQVQTIQEKNITSLDNGVTADTHHATATEDTHWVRSCAPQCRFCLTSTF